MKNERRSTARGEGGRSVVVYPLLFAVLPVLSLYGANVDQIRVHSIIAPLIWAAGGAVCSWLLLVPIVRDRHKRGLLTLAAVASFWAYGACVDAIRSALAYDSLLSPWQMGAALTIGVGIVLIPLAWIMRSPMSFHRLTVFLHVAACLSLVVAALGAARGLVAEAGSEAGRESEVTVAVSSEEDPDIVYVILDAYGSNDVLNTFYDYDNTSFLEELESRGFYVAKNSHSNYNFTHLSVPSSFNAKYLDGVYTMLGGELSLKTLMRESFVLTFLRDRGYEIEIFNNGFVTTQTLAEVADIYHQPATRINHFEQRLLDMTPIRSIVNRINARKTQAHGLRALVHDVHRRQIMYHFNTLKNLEPGTRPRFVFAHILSPHWPFVFDAQGNPIYPDIRYNLAADYPDWEAPTMDEYVTGYRGQVQAVNGFMLETLDAIIARAPDTVIILQGDHGPRAQTTTGNVESFEQAAREELGILNAYRLPGVDMHAFLYDTITPVNTFRLVFNAYFGTDFERLPDEQHYYNESASTLKPASYVFTTAH